MSAVIPGLGELQQLHIGVSDGYFRVTGLGDPGPLAGDPGSLRVYANAHRDAAARLARAQTDGQASVARVTNTGLWDGSAKEAFATWWLGVNQQIGDLAARHESLAASLDGIASNADRLNQDALLLVGEVRSWLAAAENAILHIFGLIDRGRILVNALERLPLNVEEFVAQAAQSLDPDLGYQGPVAGPIPGDPTAPIFQLLAAITVGLQRFKQIGEKAAWRTKEQGQKAGRDRGGNNGGKNGGGGGNKGGGGSGGGKR